jgi:TolB-like protein
MIEYVSVAPDTVPLVDRKRGALSGVCGRLITDELIHELVRTDGLRVTAASSVAPLVAKLLSCFSGQKT